MDLQNIINSYNLSIPITPQVQDLAHLIVDGVADEVEYIKQQWMSHDQTNLDIKIKVANEIRDAILDLHPSLC